MSFTRTLARRRRPFATPFEPRTAGGRSGGRRRARRRFRATPRFRLIIALGLVVAGLLFGVWMWVRDSSLVGVSKVTITGTSGSEAGAIQSALRSAARNMTTLDVNLNQLRTAVASFPEVKRLRVRTAFPHRMIIEVVQQRPVAVVDVGGRRVPVAADGTILGSVAVTQALPTIPLQVAPVGRRLAEGRAADAVALLAAAPSQLLPRISQVTTVSAHGLVAQIQNGPSVFFGDSSLLAAKWTAATEVLADPGSAGATYIDVTDPNRAAAGGGAPSAGAGGSTNPGTGAAASGQATGTAAANPTSASSGTSSGG